MLWSKEELIEALSGNIIEHHLAEKLIVKEVLIDSRKQVVNGLFLALKGERKDAHDFLDQAFENGCSTLIIEDKNKLKAMLSVNLETQQPNFILVKDSYLALNKLAEFSRNRSKAKIIAITGSVGKTSVKEMLKLSFSAYGKTYATQGNLNNHIGLPLSLCNFESDCEFGIFEMGMNHLNEIKPLSLIAKPHLAIITNIGPVHIENFKDEKEIALAKSEIFSGLYENGIALINNDNQYCHFIEDQAKNYGVSQSNIFTFGKKNGSFCQLRGYKINSHNSTEVSLASKDKEEITYEISTSNKVIIFNSLIIAACLDILTYNPNAGLLKLKSLENGNGRGNIFDVTFDQKNVTIIDDSYNASAISIRAGLDHILDLKSALAKTRSVAALGDMLELGSQSQELHATVAKYLQEFSIDFAILVGEKMIEAAQNLPQDSYITFLDSDSASLEIKNLLKDGDILYVKGSRGMKMEKLIEKIN